jgi:hypothetical protein
LIRPNDGSLCVKGAEYYRDTFVICTPVADEDDLLKISFKEAIDLFRFARIFDPFQFVKLLAASDFVMDQWKHVATVVVGDDLWEQMMTDLPKVTAVFNSYTKDGLRLDHKTLLEWYQVIGVSLGAWAPAARLFILLRPSSALVERFFPFGSPALIHKSLVPFKKHKNYGCS